MTEKRPTASNLSRLLLATSALLVGIQLVNMLTGYTLNQLGIYPRQLSGLAGILLAPLLHQGWWHLIANLPPLLVFVVLIAQQKHSNLALILASIALGAGALVWLFGNSALHVGASGLVLGCWGYLLASAWYYPSLRNLAIALLVILFYGGMLWSLLDFRPHISWSSHLFGCLMGIVVARLTAPKLG